MRAKLAAYASVEVNTDVLSNEIEDLKKITKLDHLPTEYNVKTATVIARDASSWTNEITIDLGSMAGVSKDMVVVASKGMVGIVNTSVLTSTLAYAANLALKILFSLYTSFNSLYSLNKLLTNSIGFFIT